MSSLSKYADISMKYDTLQKKHKNQIGSRKKDFLIEANIKGFRSIDDARLEFKSPITAISGPNGTGKTSALHLMLCAYRPSDNSEILSSKSDVSHSHIRSYFPAKVEPRDPFRADSEISYKYVRKGESNQSLKIYRTPKYNWGGYKRRPERDVYYIGVNMFIPKSENKDLSNNGVRVSFVDKTDTSNKIAKAVGRIMGRAYDKSFLYNFKSENNAKSTITLVGLEHDGVEYTENNMGFGEARIAYIVKKYKMLLMRVCLY